MPVYVPLPEDITDDCEFPPIPDRYTVESAMDWEAALLSSLEECNGDKAAIRNRQGEVVEASERSRSETP